MERRSSLTSMFHGDNGNAMNDGMNISSKVTNIYKNAIRKACLTGKKKRGERNVFFLFRKHHCVDIIMERLNICFLQCGH